MIALIIVDYNSIEKTIKYIDNSLEMINSEEEIKVIVVDNSCNNKSINYFEKLKVKGRKISDIKESEIVSIYEYEYREWELILINSNKNLGYARGNNLGAYIANKIYDNVEYYIFSNNDLKYTEKLYFNKIKDIFESDSNIAVIGPRIIGMDGRDQSPIKKVSIWKKSILYYPNMLLGNLFSNIIKNLDYDGRSKYCYWLSGSFLIVNSNKFIRVDMFDPNTFLYCEEMILSEKLLKYNYLMYFYNDFKLIHEHGKTIKNTFSTLAMEEINFNSNYYYYKEYIKTNKINLFLAKISFNLYKILFPIKQLIKKIIKRG